MKTTQTVRNMDGIQLTNVGLRQDNFETLVSQTIDEVLSILGNSSKRAIYQVLEREFKISRTEVPSKIKEFTNALEQLFGPGSTLIEIEIMKSLHSKLPNWNFPTDKKDLSFDGYVTLLSSSV